MGLEFIRAYGGRRFTTYPPQPLMWGDETNAEDETPKVNIEYELPGDDWKPVTVRVPERWKPQDWPDRPVRFIDGKDQGDTITALTSADGYPVAVRLSEIGAVVVRVDHGECRREHAVTEKVVSMVADVFPWEEVEGFASALQHAGMRLLTARTLDGQPSYQFETMRRAAEHRSRDEMFELETSVLTLGRDPSIVDGPLESRLGGPEAADWPVFGVIKSHRQVYLHELGMQVLYRIKPGQRTPAFSLPNEKLPVVSWYVRLAGGPGTMPDWGLVRVEAPLRWFERAGDWDVIDLLSRTLYDYRCRDGGYRRAPVSLHPIVRAEELLGVLCTPAKLLASRFYHLTGL